MTEPQVGWYWAQCCILDLYRIDTDEQLRETIEQHEECPGDWWENLEDAIAAYREAKWAGWGPDDEAAANALRAASNGSSAEESRGT